MTIKLTTPAGTSEHFSEIIFKLRKEYINENGKQPKYLLIYPSKWYEIQETFNLNHDPYFILDSTIQGLRTIRSYDLEPNQFIVTA
jgi:hypothetical protein